MHEFSVAHRIALGDIEQRVYAAYLVALEHIDSQDPLADLKDQEYGEDVADTLNE